MDTAHPTTESLAAELVALRGRLAAAEAQLAAAPSATAPSFDDALAEPVSRRGALRRVGVLAAGAVAGGTALAATSASPAAAATITGSGNPGVVATGVGGDGLAATTDTDTKSAVFGQTAVNGAYGAFFAHDGLAGTALEVLAHSSGTPFRPAMKVSNQGTNTALEVSSTQGYALGVVGSSGSTAAMYITQQGSGPALDIASVGDRGIQVNGVAGGVGIYAINSGVAAALQTQGTHIRFEDGGGTAPPTRNLGAGHLLYDEVAGGGELWFNAAGGTTGWRKLVGPTTAGAFHVLSSPVRVYDSRAGEPPLTGPKGIVGNGVERTIDCTVGGAIPAGATAAAVNVTVTGTVGAGFLSLYKFGIAFPGTSTLNWTAPGTTIANGTTVALDGSARCTARVGGGGSAHVLVDVVGFYR